MNRERALLAQSPFFLCTDPMPFLWPLSNHYDIMILFKKNIHRRDSLIMDMSIAIPFIARNIKAIACHVWAFEWLLKR